MSQIIQKKVCMLGEFAVGKTSLVRRFVEGVFDDKYLSTVGVSIARKSLARAGHQLNLILWDLAGSNGYARMAPSYLQGAAGGLIVFDLTRPDTMRVAGEYVALLRASNPDAALVFAANKADLEAERRLSGDALDEFAGRHSAACLSTSALDGRNVEALFLALADRLEPQP